MKLYIVAALVLLQLGCIATESSPFESAYAEYPFSYSDQLQKSELNELIGVFKSRHSEIIKAISVETDGVRIITFNGERDLDDRRAFCSCGYGHLYIKSELGWKVFTGASFVRDGEVVVTGSFLKWCT